MINYNMKPYEYALYTSHNAYGEKVIPTTSIGSVDMAIAVYSQTVEDSILYSGAEYIGITANNSINDNYIIFYGNERLKVKYINSFGRYNQVFMVRI